MNTTVDTIRAIFTYAIALVVVVGGMASLVFLRADTSGDTRVVIAGFIGLALSFVFGQEVQTRTARQAAAQTAAATTTTNGTSGGH